MIQKSHYVLRQWLIGLFGSWLCVWLLGPWLVNSILVRVHDPVLQLMTLRERDLIRWRSEGWANTLIGPHGLPGWQPNQANDKVVLWGDSQVEGFCVDDADKISNQVIKIASEKMLREIDCLPLGRSGSDAADWELQTPAVERLWHPIAHVWIVTELTDLMALDYPTATSVVDRWQTESPAPVLWAKRLHADALFQSIRNLALSPTTGGLRSLRWSVGPLPSQIVTIDSTNETTQREANKYFAQAVIDRLLAADLKLDHRLLIVYAPATPRILDKIVFEHPDDAAWEAMSLLIQTNSIAVIDMRQVFIDHWSNKGELARGFNNGTPGFGHLNSIGNRLIATAIVEYLQGDEARYHATAP